MSADAAETRVLAALDAIGVAYERVACDPALADTAAFCAHYGYDLAISANAIVVATKKEPRTFAACLVLATTRLDVNRAVRRELGGAKVSFATADEMRAATGMEVGGVTPFALPAGFPLLIDAAVAACERVIVGTGGRTSKVLVPSSALVALPGARVVEGLANPVAAAP
jgi:prolyl-tRNA editing enzyme YbaK/EbsC (Cys-tRNA(Pro) deacylase)